MRVATSSLFVITAACALAGGCTGNGLPAACEGEEPSIEIGTGVDEFIPVSEGDILPIIAGAQGGYHVDASARVGPMGQEVVMTGILTIPDAPEPEVANATSTPTALAAYDDEACTGEFWGLEVRTLSNDRQRICGMTRFDRAILEVSVEDVVNEITVSDSIEIRLRHDNCGGR